MKCPECGGATDHDRVDVGVGIMDGPEYCVDCGWSEHQLAGQVIDDWYHDIDGSAYNIDRIVDRCDKLGGPGLAQDALMNMPHIQHNFKRSLFLGAAGDPQDDVDPEGKDRPSCPDSAACTLHDDHT